MTPSLGLINLLEQFTKLRETLTCVYQFIKGYDKGWASQVAHWVKNPPAVQEVQEMWVQFQGREDPLEESKVTHASILAWRIPWTEEPGRLLSIGLHRVGHA